VAKFSLPHLLGLPSGACSKNFESEFVLDLEALRKRRRPRELKLPQVVGHLALAEEFQRLLDSGAAPNRAWLARQYELTRARVTHSGLCSPRPTQGRVAKRASRTQYSIRAHERSRSDPENTATVRATDDRPLESRTGVIVEPYAMHPSDYATQLSSATSCE